MQTKTNDIRVMIDPQIFNDVYFPYLDNMARTQIYFGGASSGKSVFIVGQRPVIDVLRGGRNYLICRAVGRTIRRSIFNQVERTILEFGVQDLFKTNKSELSVTCANGYQILFAGLDDPEKIKSITPERGAITDIVIEEATETSQHTIKQLIKRQRGGDESIPKRLVMLFNPILQDHWLFTEYFAPIGWDADDTDYRAPDGSLTILRTWFEHNRFLTQQDRADLLGETDKYYSDVYTWGKFGVLGNVIFTNWEIQDLSKMGEQFTNRRNGLDFGFSSDPASFGQIHYDGMRKILYLYNEFYERGLTNDLLADEIKSMIDDERIICDSAEPKSIQELKNLGINAVGAKKGKDSVIHGIQWLQQQKIIIDKKCINAQNEFRQYKWKEDRDGNAIRQPIDYNNHVIDWVRYAMEDDINAYRVETTENPFYE